MLLHTFIWGKTLLEKHQIHKTNFGRPPLVIMTRFRVLRNSFKVSSNSRPFCRSFTSRSPTQSLHIGSATSLYAWCDTSVCVMFMLAHFLLLHTSLSLERRITHTGILGNSKNSMTVSARKGLVMTLFVIDRKFNIWLCEPVFPPPSCSCSTQPQIELPVYHKESHG